MSSTEQGVRYNVHPIVPRAQHSLFLAAAPHHHQGQEQHQQQQQREAPQTAIVPPSPPPRSLRHFSSLRSQISPLPSFPSSTEYQPSAIPSCTASLCAQEVIAREAIMEEEMAEAVRQIPYPLGPLAAVARPANTSTSTSTSSPLLHPALQHGAWRLAIQEEIQRRELQEEEAALFTSSLHKPFRIFLSVARTGSITEMERHLRRWIARWRGARLLRIAQQQAFLAREARARADLVRTDGDALARYALLQESVLCQERFFRTAMEVVQAKAAFAVGLVALRLEERCARFPLLYGVPMRRAWVCGHVDGLTVFRSLLITESLRRQAIVEEEQRSRAAVPFVFDLQELVGTDELAQRARIEREEQNAFSAECTRAVLLLAYYTRRDVARYEAVERNLWIEHAFAAEQDVLRGQ